MKEVYRYKKKKDDTPIFYNSKEEMDKPLSVLMEELRNDVSKVRGKLFDIKQSYGWDDRIEDIEGGLTCMISAMYNIMKEWEKFEEKQLQSTNTKTP
jgi:hypothetical protein